MKQEKAKVELKVGPKGPDQKSFEREYVKDVYEVEDIIAALQDPERAKEIVAAVTYGMDLKVRAKIRAQLEAEVAGPDKAIEKTLKALIDARKASGKAVTDEWIAAKRAALSAMSAED